MIKSSFSALLLVFCTFTFAQQQGTTVGIGTDQPDPSAILDLNVSSMQNKKGMLLPRVALTSNLDVTTIASPATGLVIYNTGTAATFSNPGFYYWNGEEWRRLDEGTGVNPSILGLDCTNALLTPPMYTAGQNYTGTLSIPYNQGNGGSYQAGATALGPVNGLTYILQSGKLNTGDGMLDYTVSGVPTVSSPELTDFPISFLGNTCTARVGGFSEIKTISYARNSVSPIDLGTPINSETQIGNLRVRYNSTAAGADNIEYSPLVPTHISFLYQKAGQGAVNLETYGQRAAVPGRWYDFEQSYTASGNTNSNLNAVYRDVGYATIVLHNTKEVYRVTVNTNGNIAASGGVPATPSAVTIFVEKLE